MEKRNLRRLQGENRLARFALPQQPDRQPLNRDEVQSVENRDRLARAEEMRKLLGTIDNDGVLRERWTQIMQDNEVQRRELVDYHNAVLAKMSEFADQLAQDGKNVREVFREWREKFPKDKEDMFAIGVATGIIPLDGVIAYRMRKEAEAPPPPPPLVVKEAQPPPPPEEESPPPPEAPRESVREVQIRLFKRLREIREEYTSIDPRSRRAQVLMAERQKIVDELQRLYREPSGPPRGRERGESRESLQSRLMQRLRWILTELQRIDPNSERAHDLNEEKSAILRKLYSLRAELQLPPPSQVREEPPPVEESQYEEQPMRHPMPRHFGGQMPQRMPMQYQRGPTYRPASGPMRVYIPGACQYFGQPASSMAQLLRMGIGSSCFNNRGYSMGNMYAPRQPSSYASTYQNSAQYRSYQVCQQRQSYGPAFTSTQQVRYPVQSAPPAYTQYGGRGLPQVEQQRLRDTIADRSWSEMQGALARGEYARYADDPAYASIMRAFANAQSEWARNPDRRMGDIAWLRSQLNELARRHHHRDLAQNAAREAEGTGNVLARVMIPKEGGYGPEAYVRFQYTNSEGQVRQMSYYPFYETGQNGETNLAQWEDFINETGIIIDRVPYQTATYETTTYSRPRIKAVMIRFTRPGEFLVNEQLVRVAPKEGASPPDREGTPRIKEGGSRGMPRPPEGARREASPFQKNLVARLRQVVEELRTLDPKSDKAKKLTKEKQDITDRLRRMLRGEPAGLGREERSGMGPPPWSKKRPEQGVTDKQEGKKEEKEENAGRLPKEVLDDISSLRKEISAGRLETALPLIDRLARKVEEGNFRNGRELGGYLTMLKSQVLVKLDRRPDAQNVLAEALKRDPGNASLMNQLAWLIATDPGEIDVDRIAAALVLAEEAVKASPNKPEYRDTHAAVLAVSGRFEEAVNEEQKALELLPSGGNPETERLRAEYAKREHLYKVERRRYVE